METQDLALLRPSALNLRQLSLVEWLLSAPLGTRRFLVESPMHLKFCETGERLANGMLSVKITLPNDYGAPAKELRDFFGGKVVVSLEPLVAAGLLVLTGAAFSADLPAGAGPGLGLAIGLAALAGAGAFSGFAAGLRALGGGALAGCLVAWDRAGLAVGLCLGEPLAAGAVTGRTCNVTFDLA